MSAATSLTDGNGNSTVYLQAGSVTDVLKAIDFATGVQTFTLNGSGGGTLATAVGQAPSTINTSGQLKISTGVNADLSITGTGNALSALGLAGNTGTATAFTAARTSGIGGIAGKTLTFTAFNGGTAVNVTFGDGTNGTVKTLDQLNNALQANNLAATIDANGLLTITASNDYASSTIGSTAAGGAIGGTLTSCADVLDGFHPGPGCGCADGPCEPGVAVQQHPEPDRHDLAGLLVQRRQPA